MRGRGRAPYGTRVVTLVVVALFVLGVSATTAAAKSTHAGRTRGAHKAHVHKKRLRPRRIGGLDCNGESHIQRTIHRAFACTDVRGMKGHNRNLWEHRFYDNGVYIGHDEPDMTFLSDHAGSGNDVTWTETLGTDPSAAPTVSSPGNDVTHWVELSVAPWFSMAMCDPRSYPQTNCTPLSDTNAPTCNSSKRLGGPGRHGPPTAVLAAAAKSSCNPGGGSAFMEMQLYPPGMPPFVDSASCDDAHWCAALTIDSLECTQGFASCQSGCEEPVNFAFIQQDGVPAGPPNPQQSDLASYTPNAETLMMNPGDTIRVHMYDAAVPGGGGQKAFEVVIDDLTTGQSGYMQASAANGFANTNMTDCSGTPFNFQPEYNTAGSHNIVPWAALATNISTEFEIGHFTPCTSVTNPGSYGGDTYYNTCLGPYEDNSQAELGEAADALCFPQGDTHPAFGGTQPDIMTGCFDNWLQNGDLDYDGTPYYADWPVGPSPTAKFPGSFVQSLPSSGGQSYPKYFVQTDAALSETTCSSGSTSGCTVPPQGPGGFYPYWSRVKDSKGVCTLEFGNVSSGAGVNDLGGDAQYGSDKAATLGYPEFEGPISGNGSC